ncbi:MAG: DUF937 domain-containing protein [Alkalinema sp. RU_4_3]|nr:DUF937 domain-containing protein [Alkalinema sp. RU_4_3]
MSFFDQILSAIEDPQQQASADQLGGILGAVDQLGGSNGIDPAMMQTVMSLVGGAVQSSLQEQQSTMGPEHVMGLLSQFSGTSHNPNALGAILNPGMQQQVASGISQRTGLDAGLILGLLPVLVPVVLNLINGGSQQGGGMDMGNMGGAMPQQQASTGGNPLLNAFLDSDRSGTVDLGDALNMASQYLRNR